MESTKGMEGLFDDAYQGIRSRTEVSYGGVLGRREGGEGPIQTPIARRTDPSGTRLGVLHDLHARHDVRDWCDLHRLHLPPSSAPGGVPPGREVDGREIPIDRYLSDRPGNF